jgi:hypothetical protein
MSRIKFKVENWREVRDYMRSLDDLGKSILNDVAKAGADFARPLIENAVSRIDPSLASTVRVKKYRSKNKNKSSAVVEVGGKKKSDYAFHLETGHGHDKDSAARPFIRPTVDTHAREIADHMKDVFFEKVGLPRR